MAGRLNDLEGLKVPGPGVNILLYSPIKMKNMIINHGWKVQVNILLEKVVEML